ncbi:MAG: signal peptidase II [Desulfobacterales bacterium]
MLKNKYIMLAVVAGLVVLTDQITKALILKYLPYHHSISVITGFFDITHIHNPGGAFGMMANMGETVRTVISGDWFCSNIRRCHRQSGRQG